MSRGYNEQFHQPTNVSRVSLDSNWSDDILTGRIRPPIVTSERSESVNFVVDSADRVIPGSESPWNFIVNCSSDLYGARQISLSQLQVPRINNITIFNNSISLKNLTGIIFHASIQPGWYTPVSLCNSLATAINNSAVLSGAADTYSVLFSQATSSFEIRSVGSVKFFIVDSSLMVTGGENITPFGDPYVFPSSADPAVVGVTSVFSGQSAMLFTKYIYCCSSYLNSYGNGETRMTLAGARPNVIAFCDSASVVTDADYDPSRVFSSTYRTLKTESANFISCSNSQKSLSLRGTVDFQFYDQFNNKVADLFDLGGTFSPNQLGPTLLFEVLS